MGEIVGGCARATRGSLSAAHGVRCHFPDCSRSASQHARVPGGCGNVCDEHAESLRRPGRLGRVWLTPLRAEGVMASASGGDETGGAS